MVSYKKSVHTNFWVDILALLLLNEEWNTQNICGLLIDHRINAKKSFEKTRTNEEFT